MKLTLTIRKPRWLQCRASMPAKRVVPGLEYWNRCKRGRGHFGSHVSRAGGEWRD